MKRSLYVLGFVLLAVFVVAVIAGPSTAVELSRGVTPDWLEYVPMVMRAPGGATPQPTMTPTTTPAATATHPPQVTATGTAPPTATATHPPQATATGTASPTPTSTPGSTGGKIVITDIHADGTGPSEPDEYVEIRNDDAVAIQLAGWTLFDQSNHVFTFPNFVMQPGQSCRVYTNEVHANWCGFSYGSSSAIWNNGGDCAMLHDASNVFVHRLCYGNA